MPNDFLKKIVAISIGIAVLPLMSSAQFNLPFAPSHELGIEIIPNYPEPNESVYISLTLYSGDLNSAEITWYKNDRAVLSGTGETRYSFETGSVGTEENIEIQVKLLGGPTFTQSFTLIPAGLDLVWEGNSYVPPFYEGKALHPKQGLLKIVAIPEFIKNGQKTSPANLIYKWENDVEVYQSQSGYGKATLVLNGSLLGQAERIKVTVTDPVNNLVAEDSIVISPTDPEIIFYENSSYYGQLFDTAVLGTFDLKADEVQILAVPYHFSKENIGELEYQWRLNNQSAPDLSGSRTAIFRKPEGESGKSNISLSVENLGRVLQFASSRLTINFDK